MVRPPPDGQSRRRRFAPKAGFASHFQYITLPPVAPTRGRGSKHTQDYAGKIGRKVAPTRGRGSKPRVDHGASPQDSRRPHPGARIETPEGAGADRNRKVAPTRGRGSKHRQRDHRLNAAGVAPTRGRGSKLFVFMRLIIPSDRRPHPGARIETVRSDPSERAADGRPHPGARIETR